MAEKPHLDGFYPRRPNTRVQVGGMGFNEPEKRVAPEHKLPPIIKPTQHVKEKHTPKDTFTVPGTHNGEEVRASAVATGSTGLSRSELEQSLRDIDEDTLSTPEKHLQRKQPKEKKPLTRKKIIKRIILSIVLLLVLGGAYIIVKGIAAGHSIFKGDLFGLIQQKALQQDASGRTNILLVGTSEDDPGHQGANLTDSIMVLSVDQHNKNAYMVSIPRDLRVKYGLLCTPGSYGKINAYFSCVQEGDSGDAEQARQTAMRQFVGAIVGLNIQYSAHINYSVVRDIVNAIGNITVTIEGSNGAPGVMDSNFDWKCRGGAPTASLATMKKNCPPNGHFIDYPNGPTTLDAEHALYLAQARGDAEPTYGLSRSNYDRELNQQKIIKAIKEKSMSAGTVTNPVAVSNLLQAMGNNLRTNFDTSEIRTLMALAKDIPNDSVQSVSLVDASPTLFGDDGEGNVAPTAGLYDYTAIKAYIQKKINATPLIKEEAHVVVLNASGVAGVAKTEGDKLAALGMTVDNVGNASKSDYPTNRIFQIKKDTSAKLYTAKKLQDIYGSSPETGALPSTITVNPTTDFVIIVATPPQTTTPTTTP